MRDTILALNQQGFSVDLRNPVTNWFEVVIPVEPHGEFIVQCGGDPADCLDRAYRAAQHSKPPATKQQRIRRKTDLAKRGEEVLEKL